MTPSLLTTARPTLGDRWPAIKDARGRRPPALVVGGTLRTRAARTTLSGTARSSRDTTGTGVLAGIGPGSAQAMLTGRPPLRALSSPSHHARGLLAPGAGRTAKAEERFDMGRASVTTTRAQQAPPGARATKLATLRMRGVGPLRAKGGGASARRCADRTPIRGQVTSPCRWWHLPSPLLPLWHA